MLKAVMSSPRSGVYGVEFETVVDGRKSFAHPSTFIPCVSFDHAKAVAHAFNGVAFTETRLQAPGEPAGGQEGRAATSLPATTAEATGRSTLLDAADAVDRYHGRGRRGAPLGEPDYTAPDVTPTDVLLFSIRRVALNAGGYDAAGVYWGLPQGTLWHATAAQDGATLVSRWFREPTYAHAVMHVRAEFTRAVTQRIS